MKTLRIVDHQDRLLESVPVRQIGKGMFKTAYKALKRRPQNMNILVVSDDDSYDHEIFAEVCEGTKFIPCTEKLGWDSRTDKPIYAMKEYNVPLRKSDSPRAWKQYQDLKKASNLANDEAGYYNRNIYDNFLIMGRTIDIYKGMKGSSKALVNALTSLFDEARNYGSTYMWEFMPRNLATDKGGNLVLLDPFYDAQTVQKKRWR